MRSGPRLCRGQAGDWLLISQYIFEERKREMHARRHCAHAGRSGAGGGGAGAGGGGAGELRKASCCFRARGTCGACTVRHPPGAGPGGGAGSAGGSGAAGGGGAHPGAYTPSALCFALIAISSAISLYRSQIQSSTKIHTCRRRTIAARASHRAAFLPLRGGS